MEEKHLEVQEENPWLNIARCPICQLPVTSHSLLFKKNERPIFQLGCGHWFYITSNKQLEPRPLMLK